MGALERLSNNEVRHMIITLQSPREPFCAKNHACVCSQFTVKSQQQQSLKKKSSFAPKRARHFFHGELCSQQDRMVTCICAKYLYICATPLLEVWAIKNGRLNVFSNPPSFHVNRFSTRFLCRLLCCSVTIVANQTLLQIFGLST